MRKLLLAAMLLASSSAFAAIPSSQRDALVAIFNATGGPNWRDRTNWLGAAGTECTWYGVDCNETGTSVSQLFLDGNNLEGTFPDAIGSFPDLFTLLIHDNKLRGSIPSSIGQLTKIETMILDRNELTGTLPPSIGNLTLLRNFNADGNKLTGPLPRELGNLRAAEAIDLSFNEITGPVPPELGSLANLVTLDLAVNQLSGTIPSSLGDLPKVERINFVINELTGTIPSSLGSARTLKELLLNANRLEGPIPLSLTTLPALETLDLGRNRLTGTIPRELGNVTTLRGLDLATNQLTGPIPLELFRLTSLESLFLGDNRLTGTIPGEIAALRRLQLLSLYGNQLTGSIPTGIGVLTELTGLELHNNDLSGPIPREIGQLTKLEYIDMAGNRLSGPLPSEVGQLAKMKFFSVYENELSGPVPTELGTLSDLVILYLTSNRFTGTIPESFRNLKKLERLYLAGNAMTGSIPDWIGELTPLIDLRLEYNEFTGQIPESIGSLTNLEQFYIDYNRFSGELPRGLGNLKKLQYLSAEFNDLSGRIPDGVWTLPDLLQLRLSRNRITGSLPPAVGNLRNLEALILNGTDLEGPVPPEIGNLTNLLYLDLTSNLFSGAIPSQIGNLTKLLNLSLGGNQFRGEVPKSLANLTALDSFASDIGLNALFTTDAALRTFINTKQFDGDFELSQTVTPRDIRVSSVTDRGAVVEWSLIRYVFGGGGYQVIASKTPGGPPAVIATTASKEINSILVRGLDPTTTYHFSVATVSHPNDYQKSVLVSDFSAPVSATTTARVTAPADVDVTESPNGLVQVDGASANDDSFTLTNFGDVATNITFFQSEMFFTYEPASFTLGPGASQTVRLRVVPQPPGFYYGGLSPQGDGVPQELFINVTLLSVARPSGSVIAEPVATRVDVAGAPGSDSVGQARFRNTGTARLSGILLSDEPFLVPDTQPLTIDPGQTGSANFRIVRSRRPPDAQDGALTANLMLVYVDGSSGQTLNIDRKGLMQALAATPGVNVTLVTVVDQPRPPVTAQQPPQLPGGEVGLFIPGVASALRNFGRVVSDVSILNIGTARPISDLRVFFTPSSSTQSSVATLNSIDASKAVALANVTGIYGTESGSGTLQLRSGSAPSLGVLSKLVTIAGIGTFLGDVPVFRSDRSATGGGATALPGVRKSSSLQTDLYLQETAGLPLTARVEFLTASGTAAIPARTVDVAGFATAELLDAVPANAVTVIVTHANGGGRLAAYGRVTDMTTGDAWSVVDWSRFNRFRNTDAVRVPYVEAATAAPPPPSRGRRRAVGHDTAATTTELTIFNPGTEAVRAEVSLLDRSGRSSQREFTVEPKQTITTTTTSDAVQALITPTRGSLAVTARTYRAGSGSFGNNVPVVDAKSGLRAGQLQRFANLDDSSAATVAAGKPGTYRTGFGFVESSGSAVTVRARIALDQGRLASVVASREFAVGANQQLFFENMLRAIIGESRETSFGELRNLQLTLEVIDGRGSVVPFVVVTDNGSLDSLLRVE